ncbi:MAG: hypothetical protein Q9201_000921 [Fulgogasparrea decipioides]
MLLRLPLAAALVSAEYIIESSSFGQGDRISPNRFGIPHWHISGDGQNIPQLIKLPSGYYFGISAASADTPDSFEVYKFVTSTAPGITRELPRRDLPPQQPLAPASNPGGASSDQSSQYTASDTQFAARFADLQNHIQTLSRDLDGVLRELQQLASKSEERHQDLSHRVMSNEQLSALDRRMQSIEDTLRGHQGQFSSIQGALKDSHSTLNEGLTQQMTHRKYFSPAYIQPD